MIKKFYLWILLISVAFFTWPFSLAGVSSQILSLMLILIFGFNAKISIRYVDLFVFIFITILLIYLFNVLIFGVELNVFLFYIFKIFLIYFYAKSVLSCLKQTKISNDLFLFYISFSVILFVLFAIFQVIFPNINQVLIEYLEDYRVSITRENNLAGHQWRFLGWNGFLYASHAVALAFSAILLLVCRYKIVLSLNKYLFFYSLVLEILCLGLALLAGRSAIPLVVIYMILYIFLQRNVIKRLLYMFVMFCVMSLALILIMNTGEENAFLVWLREPIYNLIHGELQSNSVDDLNVTYLSFLQNIEVNPFLREHITFGLGIYGSEHSYYEYLGFSSSDSGIIRMTYAIGIVGTFLFMFFFFLFFLFSFIQNIRNRGNIYYSYLLGFFGFFGLVFFYKSEWLYQNFFLFYFFLLYHLSIDNY